MAKYIIEGGRSKSSVKTIDENFIPKTAGESLEKLGVLLISGLRKSMIDEYKKVYPNRTSSLSFAQTIDTSDIDIRVSEATATLTFKMNTLGMIIDKGVKGTQNVNAPNSPFQFKKKNLPKSVREGIVKDAGFKGIKSDKEAKSLAFVIGRSIMKKGIKPIPFFTNYVDKEFREQVNEELNKLFGDNITNFIISIDSNG